MRMCAGSDRTRAGGVQAASRLAAEGAKSLAFWLCDVCACALKSQNFRLAAAPRTRGLATPYLPSGPLTDPSVWTRVLTAPRPRRLLSRHPGRQLLSSPGRVRSYRRGLELISTLFCQRTRGRQNMKSANPESAPVFFEVTSFTPERSPQKCVQSQRTATPSYVHS
jgi:hypothetical protein